MADKNGEEQQEFKSKLRTGRERFLAHVVEYALEIELRTADDFIRHFPPAELMMGLRDEPTLRAQILVLTTGIKHKIAVKKSAESSGDDLQIALDEGETDAESIVALFNPDDRVRFLDNEKLWVFCIENDFWKVNSAQKVEFERAKQQVAFIIDRALEDRLVTHQEVVEGIGVGELATRLPRSELSKLIEQALANSHNKSAFTERDLLATVPSEEIVKHIPLTHVWETVVAPLAVKHGYDQQRSAEVAKALDWLDKKGEPEQGEQQEAEPPQESEPETHPKSGWTMPPDGDSDVEITDDDIRIT